MPGVGVAMENFAAAFCWGNRDQIISVPAVIAAATIDSGNSPTYEIRPGLVLGIQTATNQWTEYSATATDGSQVACGVCMTSLRMQNLLGTTQQAMFAVMCGGPVIGQNLLGLDYNARQQMRGKFLFDDDFNGQSWFPYKTAVTKTASYSCLLSDNNTQFNTLGATGSVTFTLPAIAPGLNFGFLALANQTMVISTFEGSNMIQPTTGNTITGNTLTFSTGSQKIGSNVRFYTNPGGTIWIPELYTANTQSWS